MRIHPIMLGLLLLLACSLNNGCASADDVNIPLEVEQSAGAEHPRNPRKEWLRELGARIEASSNARLSTLPGKPFVTIDGITAAYDEDSASATSVAIAVISPVASSNVVNAVQAAVLYAIKNDGIPRAEVTFKKHSKARILKTCVILNPKETPTPSTDR